MIHRYLKWWRCHFGKPGVSPEEQFLLQVISISYENWELVPKNPNHHYDPRNVDELAYKLVFDKDGRRVEYYKDPNPPYIFMIRVDGTEIFKGKNPLLEKHWDTVFAYAQESAEGKMYLDAAAKIASMRETPSLPREDSK